MKQGKKGFGGVVIGLIILLVCTVLLFKNEGRAVDRYKALGEIGKAIEITSDDTSGEDGTLILLADEVVGKTQIIDQQLGVKAPEESIKLSRQVQILQWKETSSGTEGSETYSYETVWSEKLIDSDEFTNRTYVNPKSMIYEPVTLFSEDVYCGKYAIDDVFIQKMNNSLKLRGYDEMGLSYDLQAADDQIFVSLTKDSRVDQPSVGDYLITYTYVENQKYTLLGEKHGESLVSYYTKHGDLAEVEPGSLSKAALEAKKVSDNKGATFAFRIILIIGVIIANGLIWSPLTNLISHIPLLGKFINGSIKLVSTIIGIIWSLIIIAIGWIFYRPLLAIGLLVIVAGLIYLMVSNSKVDGLEKEQELESDVL